MYATVLLLFVPERFQLSPSYFCFFPGFGHNDKHPLAWEEVLTVREKGQGPMSAVLFFPREEDITSLSQANRSCEKLLLPVTMNVHDRGKRDKYAK